MSHHLLEARDLGHRYADGTEALKGLTFRVGHGECVALIGPSGAGKSTLLLHLNGTLAPTAGSVHVGARPVVPTTLRDIRRTVGLVFQDPDDQLFQPSVLEDVMFGPLNLGLPPEEATQRAREALASVGAAHLEARAPHRLSAGEKRRCALAGVLAMEPDILVLDEPTAGLDPGVRRKVIHLLQAFTHTRLVATHDLDLVLDLCPRVLLLHDGRLAADGPSAEILADADLMARCGLEVPAALRPCPACGARRGAQGA